MKMGFSFAVGQMALYGGFCLTEGLITYVYTKVSTRARGEIQDLGAKRRCVTRMAEEASKGGMKKAGRG